VPHHLVPSYQDISQTSLMKRRSFSNLPNIENHRFDPDISPYDVPKIDEFKKIPDQYKNVPFYKMDGDNYQNRPIMSRRNGNVPDVRFTKPSFLSSLLSPLNPFKTKPRMHNAISTQNKDVQRQQNMKIRKNDKVKRRRIPYKRRDHQKVDNKIHVDKKPRKSNETQRKINRRKSPIPFKERITKHEIKNSDQAPASSNINKDRYKDKITKSTINRKDDFDGLDLSFWEDDDDSMSMSTTRKPDYRHRWQNLSRVYNDSNENVASDRLDVTEYRDTDNLEAFSSPVFSNLGDALWDEINDDWNNDERVRDLSARYLTAWADVARIGTTPKEKEPSISANVNSPRRNPNQSMDERNQRLMFHKGNRQRRRHLRRTRL